MSEPTQIETPLKSGATDNPDAAQTQGADVGRNEATSAAAGYPVQHVLFDMSKAKPIQGANKPIFDMSKAKPVSSYRPDLSQNPPGVQRPSLPAGEKAEKIGPYTPAGQNEAQTRVAGVAPGTKFDPVEIAKGTGKELLGQIDPRSSGVIPTAKSAYTGITQEIPALYRAYEDARSRGASVYEAYKAADDVAKQIQKQKLDAVNIFKQRAKEFADNPNSATGRTIADLLPLIVGSAFHSAPGGGVVNAIREAAIGAPGGGVVNAIREAAIGEETGGAEAIAPKPPGPLSSGVVKVGETNVPVRGTSQIGEMFAARKPLQEFDITQTQPAATEAVKNIAGQTLMKEPVTGAVVELAKAGKIKKLQNFIEDLYEYQKTGRAQGPGIPPQIPVLSPADAEAAWKETVTANSGDFGVAAKTVHDQLRPYFNAADKEGYAAAREQYDAAYRVGDYEAMETAKNLKKSSFEKANGPGSFEAANTLYSKLDDLDAINKAFNAASVIKPTPNEFLGRALEAAKARGDTSNLDPGIIDGAALRKSVLKLSNDGVRGGPSTFDRAGVSPKIQSQLQELGSLLEKSTVKDPTIFSKLGDLANYAATGKVPLTLEIAGAILAGHPIGAIVAVGMWGASRLLAFAMTHPNFLNSAVKALRVIDLGGEEGAIGFGGIKRRNVPTSGLTETEERAKAFTTAQAPYTQIPSVKEVARSAASKPFEVTDADVQEFLNKIGAGHPSAGTNVELVKEQAAPKFTGAAINAPTQAAAKDFLEKLAMRQADEASYEKGGGAVSTITHRYEPRTGKVIKLGEK